MGAVPEFGHALLQELGAPRGHIQGFAEVRLPDGAGKVSIPDGAIVVERGQRRWRALVEVKTGPARLTPDQVSRYLEMARDHGFDCLVTISNEVTAAASELPVEIDRRRTRRVQAYHLSWWRVITEAILQHRFRGVSDPDQAWILGELIAYLDHENSGASGFQDMGAAWARVRDGARQGTLRPADAEVRAVAERWEHFLDYLALGMSQDLGRSASVVRPRNMSTSARLDALATTLASTGQLSGAIRVPDAIAPLALVADLRARQTTTSITIQAPREGRARGRIGWMLRQLQDAPHDLRIEVAFANTRDTTSVLLADAREYRQRLMHPSDPRREPRSFELARSRPMGLRRGKGEGSFIRETRRQVLDFYGEVIQQLKPWQPRAPRLPEPPVEVPERPQAEPPPFGAVDDRDVGEATTPLESSEGSRLEWE
jgi:hypothetical protein